MEFKFVSPNNLDLLSHILSILKQKYPKNSNLEVNFYRSIPQNKEFPFAIATTNGKIKCVYQLTKELKFTRGMQTVYHTQQLFNELNENEINEFQKWVIKNLDGYKILGLNVTSKKVFQPHQVYMEAKNRANL